MDAKRTGAFIAERRKALGLTQLQLAERLHVTDKAVSRWERGVGLPDVGSMEALSQALEVSIVELMQGQAREETHISTAEADELLTEALHLSELPFTAYLAKSLFAACVLAAIPVLWLIFAGGGAGFCNAGSILLGLAAWSLPLIPLARIRGRSAAMTHVVSFSLALLSLALQFFEILDRVEDGDWSALMDTVPTLTLVVVFFSAVTIVLNVGAARYERHRSRRAANSGN